jgi:glycine/D-amino acid oxidase-like deaminating enzyme
VSQLAPSLWAAVTPALEQTSALAADMSCSAVVVGGGFTGLSAALHLAGAGCDVILLEAAEPGFGASGRNNGQVIPTLTRANPEDIVRAYGGAGERLVALIRDSADDLFATARRLGIDADAEAEQTGWVQPAHTPGRLKISQERVRQWSNVGARVELHDRAQMRDITGSDAWFGGFSAASGGHVNPLGLSRGLAKAAVAAGVKIFTQSLVVSFSRENGRWIAKTARGKVGANMLVLATHGYTDHFTPALAPDISREIVPVLSWQMATQPLPDDLRKTLLPGRLAMSDTHGDLHFARYDARNRLVTGGALAIGFNGYERLKPRIAARLKRLWPQIGEPAFDHVWNGYISMTTDFLPRAHKLGPGAIGWAGCNGRGVALALGLGREMARSLLGAPDDEVALPFVAPRPLPFHGVLRRLAPFKVLEYRIRDAMEI